MRLTYLVPRNIGHAPLDSSLGVSLDDGGGVVAGSGSRPRPVVREKIERGGRSRVFRNQALELAPTLRVGPFELPVRPWTQPASPSRVVEIRAWKLAPTLLHTPVAPPVRCLSRGLGGTG